MLYYKALTGSRQLKINMPQSDIDFALIDTKLGNISLIKDGEDLHSHLPEIVIKSIFDEEKANIRQVHHLLFSMPVVETEFSKYLLANREKLIISNLPRFGEILYDKGLCLALPGRGTTPLGKIFPKRVIWALVYLSAYVRYATEQITFEEAFQPTEELRQFILDIRNNQIPYEPQEQRLQTLLKQAEDCKDFHNKNPDLETFYKIRQEMMELLDLT